MGPVRMNVFKYINYDNDQRAIYHLRDTDLSIRDIVEIKASRTFLSYILYAMWMCICLQSITL